MATTRTTPPTTVPPGTYLAWVEWTYPVSFTGQNPNVHIRWNHSGTIVEVRVTADGATATLDPYTDWPEGSTAFAARVAQAVRHGRTQGTHTIHSRGVRHAMPFRVEADNVASGSGGSNR